MNVASTSHLFKDPVRRRVVSLMVVISIILSISSFLVILVRNDPRAAKHTDTFGCFSKIFASLFIKGSKRESFISGLSFGGSNRLQFSGIADFLSSSLNSCFVVPSAVYHSNALGCCCGLWDDFESQNLILFLWLWGVLGREFKKIDHFSTLFKHCSLIGKLVPFSCMFFRWISVQRCWNNFLIENSRHYKP